MTSKLRDFNLLKVADVSSNSTTNNSFSVVVNAESQSSSGEKKESQTIFPPNLSTQPNSGDVIYGSLVNEQELENELKFYKLLSQTLYYIGKCRSFGHHGVLPQNSYPFPTYYHLLNF